MIFRQLFDEKSWTYTYLLADEATKDAVLIDPVYERHERDLALVRELGLTLRYTIDTHAHADHATGAWLMRKATGSKIAVSKDSGASGADALLAEADVLRVGGLEIEARATPGHTNGCMTFVLAREKMAFTGDALLIRGAGRTDFQQGDARQLYKSVRERILSLPGDFALYPGHDYSGRSVTTVAEERAHNPRLGDGIREQDFVAYMDNLGLPHPAKIDEAVPANLRCGAPADGAQVPSLPDWGPVVRTFAGVLEVNPEWVHAHRSEVTLIDVRETKEIEGSPLGTIEGAVSIPLSELRNRLGELPRDRPAISVCPAGGRSAQAALILEKGGVPNVANLPGGLFRWQALGFPLVPSRPR